MTPRARTESRPVPLRSPQRAVGLFLGAAILAVLIVAPALVPGRFVPRVTLENPTFFDINVEVADGERSGWLDLGTMARGERNDLEEIADAGGAWVLRFSYGGLEAGEMTVARSDLRAADWRMAIPAEVGHRLTEAGFVASAR